MKIRRKAPKPSKSAQPLYVIGYSVEPIPLPHLQAWFDLEYGGPLRLGESPHRPQSAGEQGTSIMATHGPWSASVTAAASPSEAETWKDRLSWRHPHTARVVLASAKPSDVCDLVLHAARLARGLTLLTEGTAYDLVTAEYLNPSDWQNRPLREFSARDHIATTHHDADRPDAECFHTRGLTKFGKDELETFRPLGLPSQPTLDRLHGIAAELLHTGRQLKVGETLVLDGLGLSISVVKHRTAQTAGGAIPVREIQWEAPS